ncbi:2-phosphoxylose phosphatase 1-like [Oppia nitens]|uniref:2-phosphoxylose phosphatase 1-like n=1 Tax=Oppia nitens TaxID=1686743 RepID=UPI0023DA1BB8|nr:2-phosphoxylose phosphatase 1-like [Oppia nitens]
MTTTPTPMMTMTAHVMQCLSTKRLLSALIALIAAFIVLTLLTYSNITDDVTTVGVDKPVSSPTGRLVATNGKSSAAATTAATADVLDMFDKLSISSASSSSSSKSIQTIRNYCNVFTSISLNDELMDVSSSASSSADSVIPDLSLRHVSVLIRHGDRGPLRPVRGMSAIRCDPFIAGSGGGGHQSINYELNNNNIYKNFFGDTNRLRQLSKNYAKTPNSGCELGGLTRYGCVQHLTLGSLLARTYVPVLNLTNHRQMKVLSTPYSRTYQSALAFTYGFWRPKSIIDFNTFPRIITTYGTYFCSSPDFCTKRCKRLESLQKLLNDHKQRILGQHPAVSELLADLKLIVANNSADSRLYESPVALFDGLMAYMCHNSGLPCNDDDDDDNVNRRRCVTLDKVKELVTFVEFHGKQMLVSDVFRHINWLKIYGFLKTLVKSVVDINSPQNRDNRFVLYSGHDITIVALASALDFFDGIIPPYASRVIFEVYEQSHGSTTGDSSSNTNTNNNKYYLRIVYNGKDVTRFTEICKLSPQKCHQFNSRQQINNNNNNINLISVNDFSDFIDDKFLQITQTMDYQKACDL